MHTPQITLTKIIIIIMNNEQRWIATMCTLCGVSHKMYDNGHKQYQTILVFLLNQPIFFFGYSLIEIRIQCAISVNEPFVILYVTLTLALFLCAAFSHLKWIYCIYWFSLRPDLKVIRNIKHLCIWNGKLTDMRQKRIIRIYNIISIHIEVQFASTVRIWYELGKPAPT